MPKNGHAIGCIRISLCLKVATQQAVEVEGSGKVGTLPVGKHFNVMDASCAHQFKRHPVAMGQGIDQILVADIQHIITRFPVDASLQATMFVLTGVEGIVITVDVESNWSKSSGSSAQ